MINVVITADGEGYYLSNATSETDEAVAWGEMIEFDGKLYVANVDESGENVTLYELKECAAGSYEAVAEEDGDEEEEEIEDADEDEDEEAEVEA